jgi:hypothetical protein
MVIKLVVAYMTLKGLTSEMSNDDFSAALVIYVWSDREMIAHNESESTRKIAS